MASTSSATIMASSGDKACRYDVFLSFCGQDTRYSFTDHLYHGLTQAGIGTYRDNEEINKGEELKPEFTEAIQESKGSIVVLSKNYATSTWCLDELLLILEQKSKGNHFVLPVFYGVEPTDIRNQKGSFAIEVQSSTKWTEQKVCQWKTALLEVADLAGFVVSGYGSLPIPFGSTTVQGLALDMKVLSEEDIAFKQSNLKTDALENMDRLKLLQLNFVELSGSYENFSEDLRWLCWLGFRLTTIPPNLYMGNLVAIDMSYSNLEVFKPPMVLQSLRILNLKDSHNLTVIHNISKLPHLETLILWNCYSLVHVCNTIGELTSLSLLNMTGCNNTLGYLTKPTFPFPISLRRLFLKDCRLECTDSFPLSFSVQLDLQYLNLGNSLFEALPCYNHLKNLRVLDLSFCSRLKCLICLPSTLAELYIYGCELVERITFQTPRFTLQEFGYLGCINLYEVEGFVKLVPIAKLVATDLGHMKWLQKYQYYQMCLGGDDELTEGRSWHIQMLYEFDILSTFLPDIKDPNMTPKYISKTSSLSFDVPSCPKSKRLKGINIALKYALSGDDWVWFCKVGTANGVDLMYSPKVFGKPEVGEVCIWLSYWPIGYTLKTGDTVTVSIVVLSGLEVHECGVSLVYSDNETLESNMECAEILGGDLSGFQLSTGAYYLCRRDFFELVEVGRLTPDWFSILVGDTIDNTEVRGWRKTGLPKHVIPSFTELKTIRCIIHGPQLEDIYNITEMSKLSTGAKTMALTSSLIEGEMKSGISTELIDETMEEQKQSESMSKASISDNIRDSAMHSYRKKVVLKEEISKKENLKIMRKISGLKGIESIASNDEGRFTVIGDFDPVDLVSIVSKIAKSDILSVEPANKISEKEKEKKREAANVQ